MKAPVDNVEDFLKALADKSRLDIIKFLKSGEKSSQEIQDLLKKGQSTVSQQIKILILANILTYRQEGVKKFYSVKDPKIFQLLSQINGYILSQSALGASLDIIDTLS